MNDPFRYRPSAQMSELAADVVKTISADSLIDSAFHEGKMLGLLRHSKGWSIAYSGKKIAAVEERGFPFVPPVYDVTVGPFREKEDEISSMNRKLAQLEASGASQEEISQLKLTRAMESVKLQKWTFEQYRVLNARGEEKSVLEIFAQKGILPPASAGDCAAPKLLQHAYLNGLEPLEIGEFWYGASPYGPVRTQGRFYPSCSWKCGPILSFMLQGLTLDSVLPEKSEPRILFEDTDILVVDKPSGMPAVPGLDGLESLETWLGAHVAAESEDSTIFQVHRLDQDTSGLMVFAKNRWAQAALQRQFEAREVDKEYVAIVIDSCSTNMEFRPLAQEGTVDLPLAPDFEDKPRQKVDKVQGKPAVTEYRFAKGSEADSIFRHFGVEQSPDLKAVVFHPKTGRSHQLRVHSAHPLGLNMPILGDTLYGGASQDQSAKRLCLHASSLTFSHPATGERMEWNAIVSILCR